MSRRVVAGNWKMTGDRATCQELARGVARGAADLDTVRCQLVVFPPLPYLLPVREALTGSPVEHGGQDLHWEPSGAFTGEVSAGMLRDCGCRWVLVGHSERRHVMGDSDEVVRRKLEAARGAGLRPILCVGETEAEREDGLTRGVLERQLTIALEGLTPGAGRLEVAYEPVWAIGTGKTATPDIIAEAHAAVRDVVSRVVGSSQGEEMRVLYGGSVKPGNAAEIFAVEGVDGLLVGGASLDADGFLAIARTAPGP